MRENWTREQTIVAFNVYCKIPFKSSSKANPTIIKYAKIIGRSPSALNMKIGNFGRLDPELAVQGITGLSHGSRMEEEVWNEFHGNWDALAFESEKLTAEFQNKRIEEIEEYDIRDLPEGKDRTALVKTRVNQSFFRGAVLSAYNFKCCITGLSVPQLLVASHIVPWAKDIGNRTNPRNGLCLNALHDKAFDAGFISISPDFEILISNKLDNQQDMVIGEFFKKYASSKIMIPDKFLPAREFLEFHNSEIFKH